MKDLHNPRVFKGEFFNANTSSDPSNLLLFGEQRSLSEVRWDATKTDSKFGTATYELFGLMNDPVVRFNGVKIGFPPDLSIHRYITHLNGLNAETHIIQLDVQRHRTDNPRFSLNSCQADGSATLIAYEVVDDDLELYQLTDKIRWSPSDD